MADMLVVVFDNQEDGVKALKAFREIEKEGQVHLEDTALIVKEPDGKVHVKNELDSGVEAGAVVGGIIGGVLMLAFPVAGMALGAAAGAGIGSLFEKGVDKKFVQEVRDELKPDSSALFLMISSGNTGAEVAALRGLHGKVLQTTFDPDLEKEFKHAMQ